MFSLLSLTVKVIGRHARGHTSFPTDSNRIHSKLMWVQKLKHPHKKKTEKRTSYEAEKDEEGKSKRTIQACNEMTKGSYEASKYYQFQLLQNENWAQETRIFKSEQRIERGRCDYTLLICMGLSKPFHLCFLSFKSPCALYMLQRNHSVQRTHSAHRTKIIIYENPHIEHWTLNMEWNVWNDEWAREYVRIVLFRFESQCTKQLICGTFIRINVRLCIYDLWPAIKDVQQQKKKRTKSLAGIISQILTSKTMFSALVVQIVR